MLTQKVDTILVSSILIGDGERPRAILADKESMSHQIINLNPTSIAGAVMKARCLENLEPASPDGFRRDHTEFNLTFNHEQSITGHDQVIIKLVKSSGVSNCGAGYAKDGGVAGNKVEDMELPTMRNNPECWSVDIF